MVFKTLSYTVRVIFRRIRYMVLFPGLPNISKLCTNSVPELTQHVLCNVSQLPQNSRKCSVRWLLSVRILGPPGYYTTPWTLALWFEWFCIVICVICSQGGVTRAHGVRSPCNTQRLVQQTQMKIFMQIPCLCFGIAKHIEPNTSDTYHKKNADNQKLPESSCYEFRCKSTQPWSKLYPNPMHYITCRLCNRCVVVQQICSCVKAWRYTWGLVHRPDVSLPGFSQDGGGTQHERSPAPYVVIHIVHQPHWSAPDLKCFISHKNPLCVG